MRRKGMTVAAMFSAVAVVLTGFSMAADDESPMAKLMEKVNQKNLAITKGVRTAVAYKKDQKKVAEAAAELVTLGKEAKKDTESAKKQKKSQAEWEKLMEEYIVKSQELADAAGKPSTTQAQAKAAHQAVKATCTNCHNVFRVEDADN